MRVSNRRKDLAASKRMEQVMSAVYAKHENQSCLH